MADPDQPVHQHRHDLTERNPESSCSERSSCSEEHPPASTDSSDVPQSTAPACQISAPHSQRMTPK
ncbi:hypothetical protein Hanom_Chr11g00990581 [Helianthus anomalus]